MRDRRLGKIKFSLGLLEDQNARFTFEQALYGIIPVRAETLYFDDMVELIGCGSMFDELEPGEMIPEYIIEFHSENGEVTEWEFKRV